MKIRIKDLLKSKIFLRQIVSYLLIICITFASFAIVLLTITRIAIEKQQLSMVENYRREVAETMHRWLRGRIHSIKSQALYLEQMEESLGKDVIKDIINRQMTWDKNFYDIMIIDSQGNIINSRDGKLDHINLADRQYFKNGMMGVSTVTGFFKDRKGGNPIMAISRPISIQGKPEYILAGYITLERFKEMAETLSLGDFGHAYLVDAEGTFITDSAFILEFIEGGGIVNKDKYRLNTDAVNHVIKKEQGTGKYKDFMGDKVFGSYEWLEDIQAGIIVEFKDAMVMKPIRNLLGTLGAIGAIIIAFGMLFAILFTRRIIGPIESLIYASKNIASQNYQAPLDISTNSELDILVEQFNQMQMAISAREGLLEKKNQELKSQRAEAIEANKLKSQFLANMSHELRTPLNSIIGFTTRVIKKTGDTLPPVQLENLTIVKEEAQHLLELINNLLDYSKVEAGKMEVYPESFNLIKVAGEVRTMAMNLTDGKSIDYVESFYNTETIPIFNDRLKIKQILINLLSNAFKYSEKGTIKFSIDQQGDVYRLIVEDQGIGIDPEDIDNIFDEFRQIDGSYTRKVGGTGLGLSITKRFIEMLGGRIEVTSTVDVGSRFTVYLPMRYEVLSEHYDQVLDVDAILCPSKKRVVCIDDDHNVQKLYRQYLDEEGYNVIALDGKENVIENILRMMPDIILLDIMLPNKDGWELLGELKNHPQTKNIPVIMASVLNERNLAYKLRADEYLVKPVTQEELSQTIANTIATTMTNKNGIYVLVADDDENYLNLMGQFLREEGIHYGLARNGKEALECIESRKPDILILDIMMPEKDGFDVIESVKQRNEWESMAIVVVTAKNLNNTEKDILRHRANHVIEKSGVHIESIMEILLHQIKEKTKDA